MRIAHARALALLLAGSALLGGAAPAAAHEPQAVSSYYIARGDPRLCPSPVCGGYWVRLVNRVSTTCGDGTVRRECYVAEADLTRVPVTETVRTRLSSLLGAGRALVRGAIVQGRVHGFPELGTLVVSEGWQASSSSHAATGVFRRLHDNGVRCVTAPCFWITGAELNASARVELSHVDLTQTGTPLAERRRALARIATGMLVAVGRVTREPKAGPAGAGRELVALQFFVRAG